MFLNKFTKYFSTLSKYELICKKKKKIKIFNVKEFLTYSCYTYNIHYVNRRGITKILDAIFCSRRINSRRTLT